MKKLKLALRSLLYYKQYSVINILGLALSLACVIIIFRYVYGEFTVDRFNRNFERIFVTTVENRDWGGMIRSNRLYNRQNLENVPNLTQHAGVEKYSHFIYMGNSELEVDSRKFDAELLVADNNFLSILDFPIIMGVDRLQEPNSALITQELAQRIFGNENPIGQTFSYFNQGELVVTGIIGQTSTKSSLEFDVVLPIGFTMWQRGVQAFVLLYPNVDYREVNSRNLDFIGERRRQLFPLSDVYLHSNHIIQNREFAQGNFQYVVILALIGLLILLVGVINYINIHTVITLRRGKELGVKKIFGASVGTIFMQMLIDNALMVGLALVLGLIFMVHSLIVCNKAKLPLKKSIAVLKFW
jgi:hypothetical protein